MMTVTGMMNLLLSHNIAALTDCFSVLASQEPGFFSTTNLIGLGIIAVGVLIGGIVQANLREKIEEYSCITGRLTGAEVARMMLDQYGLQDVKVTHVPGALTDHYNPQNKTVNLSDMVYSETSLAAIAVAAHECGHAVQDAEQYCWGKLRSELVPFVAMGAPFGQALLTIGLLLAIQGADTTLAWIGLSLFASSTLFALVTLPVEFDASRRALAWLGSSGLANQAIKEKAASALHWAAMTYVSAALSSIALVLYYVISLVNARFRR